MLTGGFPCQDISVAGKQKGIEEGERSGLWSEYYRAIREIRPRVALIENVSAITRNGLDVVLADLAQAGYDAEWHDIRASDLGAKHRRERLFIVAYPQHNGSSSGKKHGSTLESSHRSERGEKRTCKPERSSESEGSDDLQDGERSGMADTDKTGSQTSSSELVEQGEARPAITATAYSRSAGRNRWSTEPGMGRVVNGVPDRVDRIKALGNAVVPQKAEAIGKIINQVYFGETDNEA